MKIEKHLIPESTLEKFADEHGLILQMYERSKIGYYEKLPRWYCSFAGVEILGDGVLIGASGNGETEQEAMIDYASQLTMQTIVINSYRKDRIEIKVPRLIKGITP